MLKKTLLIIFTFFLVNSSILVAAPMQTQTSKNWSQITIRDLHTMHDILVNNTPQYYR